MKQLPQSLVSQRGISIVEILVDIIIFVFLAIAIVNLSSLGTRTSLDSEHRTVALGVVNERIEQIRALPYESIGYNDGGSPDGVLSQSETVNRSQQNYTLDTIITLIDDPLNGTMYSLTEQTADYKKIQVRLQWQAASNDTREVESVTYVAPTAGLVTPTPCVEPPPENPSASPCPEPTTPPAPTPTPCVPFFRCS
jgi:hypothetical protein